MTAVNEDWPTTHPVAETLLAWCNRQNPSFLALGACEHSKFREDFFGGVTSEILTNTKIPVLLSH